MNKEFAYISTRIMIQHESDMRGRQLQVEQWFVHHHINVKII